MLAVVRRNPRFRRLWIAQLISQGGGWFNRVAVLTLISELGGQTEAYGALFAVELAIRLLPTAFFTPLAGPLADRLPRKLLMIGADLSQALLVLGFILVDEPHELPLLYGLLFANMSVGIFFESARSASVPNTLPADELHEAYALSAASWSMMLALGAMLGGFAVNLVGVRGVFLIDSLTYLTSALLLVGLALPPTPTQPDPFRWGDVLLLRELRRALGHVRELGLVPALLAKAAWGGAGGYIVMLSVAGSTRFGKQHLAGTPEADDPSAVAGRIAFATGALLCARGLGTGIGPILGRRLFGTSERALLRQIAVSFVLASGCYACFGPAPTLPLAFLFVTLAHMGGSTIWVCSTTLWQRRVDDAFRGRVFALEFLWMTLSFTAGGWLGGALYDSSGSIAFSAGWISLLVFVCGMLWTLHARSRRYAG